MKLLEAIEEATRSRISPTFSLFHVSATGDYKHLGSFLLPGDVVEAFKREALKIETVGLEVRVDGMRVEFDGV